MSEDLKALVAYFCLLAVIIVALLFAGGCASAHELNELEGPPLYVHLCDAMSPSDREAWGTAAGDINEARGELALFVGHGPPQGCSTVNVCEGRANTIGDNGCVVRLRYVRGAAWEVAEGGLLAALEASR